MADLDIVVDDIYPTDEAGSKLLTCGECGELFEHAGRGRKPKNCPEHRNIKSSTSGGRSTKVASQVEGLYVQIALGLDLAGKFTNRPVLSMDSKAVADVATDAGKAWSAAAATNPAIRKAIDQLFSVSVYGQLIAAHAPLVMALAVNHMTASAIKTMEQETMQASQPVYDGSDVTGSNGSGR